MCAYGRDTLIQKKDVNFITVIGKPKYVFKCDSMDCDNVVEAVAGNNVIIPFKVILSNTTLDEKTGHVVTKVDGSNRSTIKQSCIIFSEVEKSDEGTYSITCCDNNALEGKEIFKLNVDGTYDCYL